MSGALACTRPLLKVTLRHEIRGFAPWIAIATGLSASSVLVYPWIFPEAADRAGLSAAMSANPAIGMVFGPAFDLMSDEGFNAWRSLALAGFLTALGSILTVTRTTRGQEDSGQAELLASGVLGRASRLLAGVGVALVGSVLVGVIAGLVTVQCGGAWEPSMLLAATFTASGWMFAAIAAVTAQLGSDARVASSLAVATLGALFALRGFAYAIDAPAWTIWINPLGWMTETRPASGDHWWPLMLAAALTVVALAVAFAIQARRDFGQGIIASRPGPAEGRVRSPLGLALRINRPPLISWAIAFAALGVVFGYFATSVQDLLAGDSAVAGILASGAATSDGLTSAFLVTILSLVGIIAAVPGVQAMQKLRAEEMADRVDPVLAGAVSRRRLFAGSASIALLAPSVYVLGAGTIVAALAAGTDIGVTFGGVLLQAAATVPAVWTTVAVAIAVIGARPQVSVAAWAGVMLAFVLTLLGPTFKLWDWVLAISPFWHVPTMTQADPDGWGLAWITLVTAALVAAGFAGFRRRDIGV
ncbi:ABC transporter membrane-spanning protein [Microbacterium sorbitolivorans]|uniref:Multidrug ABC transporter permease n=1 Tax=Microbacterium sorbitolivorans TaxID=1867410 RepID=A0A367Y6L4_9MICO|nr:ABC transporter permease [Microbacterium sorbitolivorans]RCK61478.1 multidrug ABC transporter permease [Microbacterium sorbitolivorans]GGF31823.1 ABC transporter membrane-spanning protein [Microbacterium sorbitolivorans]